MKTLKTVAVFGSFVFLFFSKEGIVGGIHYQNISLAELVKITPIVVIAESKSMETGTPEFTVKEVMLMSKQFMTKAGQVIRVTTPAEINRVADPKGRRHLTLKQYEGSPLAKGTWILFLTTHTGGDATHALTAEDACAPVSDKAKILALIDKKPKAL